MRKWILILMCLCSFSLYAEKFQKTYNRAPLTEVLRDLESHFGCSFMYRPQDLAGAPTITASFSTDDCIFVLNKVLGKQLVFTRRKHIFVITRAPQKQEEVKQPPTVVRAQAELVQKDTISSVPKYVPVTTLPANRRMEVAPVGIKKVEQPRKYPPSKLQYLKHSLFTTASVGYGSELHITVSAQYAWFFTPHWGMSTGLSLCDMSLAKYDPTYQHEGFLGIPLTLQTQWPLTPKWGIHAYAGIDVRFFMYDTVNKNLKPGSATAVAIAAIHATYRISRNAVLLMGIYTDPAGLWSIGGQLGFQIGK